MFGTIILILLALSGPTLLLILLPFLTWYFLGWVGLVVYVVLLIAFFAISPYERGFYVRYTVKPWLDNRFSSRRARCVENENCTAARRSK